MSGAPVWREANELMHQLGFDHHRVRRAQIWAARDHDCPKCPAKAFQPCLNLLGVKKFGAQFAKENKFPHPERIDWERLTLTLRDWKW